MAQEAVHAAADTVEHGAVSHPPELPNFIHLLHEFFAENPVINFLYAYQNQVFAFLIIGVIALFFYLASKKSQLIPTRLQAMAEMLVESLLDVVSGILGEKEARRYFPFLASIFIYILLMNWFGLIPFMKSPTSSILVTGALAICVFVFVQFTAIQRLGVGKYFYHLMGEPKDAITWCMVPLFLPLHIMEEFIKPLSLACRLYGNVFGEDVLLGVGLTLGIALMGLFGAMAHLPLEEYIGIPLHFPFIFLAILLSTIQALVFTLLSTVYISMVLPHEDHEEDGH